MNRPVSEDAWAKLTNGQGAAAGGCGMDAGIHLPLLTPLHLPLDREKVIGKREQ